MNLLDDLFFKYHADKTPRIKHHYSDTYFELFKNRRETVKKVLEIGTAEGASLFAWRDFFPNATIYGGEIEQKRVDLMNGQERMRVFQCDQSNISSLEKLLEQTGGDLDLVIDDGSHKTSDQFFSCLNIVPMLAEHFIYIIEDVHELEIEHLLNIVFEYRYKIEMIKCGDRWDDNLVIVRNYQ